MDLFPYLLILTYIHMKKTLIIALLVLTTIFTYAQTDKNSNIRKIEVTGSAEMEVVPDIIYFSISLKEFYDGKTKVSIDQLEKNLTKAVSDAGIAKENFSINNIYGYNYYWNQKRDPNFEARKQYRLKLSDLSKINDILGKMDPKAVESVYIENYDHSKIIQYRKELKIKALQAAKEKAEYLLASIGKSCGDPIEIQEMDGANHYPMPYLKSANMAMESFDAGSANIDFKSIKMNQQIRVVFEIK